MRKHFKLYFLFVAFLATMSASCKKEYTCHCITMSVSSGFEGDVKIKSAKNGTEACSSMNKTSVDETTTCTLK